MIAPRAAAARVGIGVTLAVEEGPDVLVAGSFVERSWKPFVDLRFAQTCHVPVVDLSQIGEFDAW
nr:hypothetical protein [Nocardioides sp.]